MSPMTQETINDFKDSGLGYEVVRVGSSFERPQAIGAVELIKRVSESGNVYTVLLCQTPNAELFRLAEGVSLVAATVSHVTEEQSVYIGGVYYGRWETHPSATYTFSGLIRTALYKNIVEERVPTVLEGIEWLINSCETDLCREHDKALAAAVLELQG